MLRDTSLVLDKELKLDNTELNNTVTTSNSHVLKGRRIIGIAGGKTTINEKRNQITNDTSTTTHLANESKKTTAGNGAGKVLE